MMNKNKKISWAFVILMAAITLSAVIIVALLIYAQTSSLVLVSIAIAILIVMYTLLFSIPIKKGVFFKYHE